jgi:tetratricopeptide (TPR) repeat protein
VANPAPADRPWDAASIVAALAGDAAAADALLAAYRRDNASIARDPVWEGARVAGHVALAKGQYREAIAQLQQAGRRKTAADGEEAFLIAMAFDRSGTPDSAITWFTTMLDPREARMLEQQYPYRAAAEKRLAELLDAKGDAAGAITHYEQFATLWKDAEPSRQPVVKAARDRAAQLRGKKDPG